jgi:hypothetical protein
VPERQHWGGDSGEAMTLSDTPNSFKHLQSIVPLGRVWDLYPSVILFVAYSEQTKSGDRLCK